MCVINVKYVNGVNLRSLALSRIGWLKPLPFMARYHSGDEANRGEKYKGYISWRIPEEITVRQGHVC